MRWLVALAVVFVMPADARAQRTVILVRHAEKEPGSGDVALSADGRRRADNLARVLKDAGVDAIVTSDTRRARQTAEPIAKALGLKPATHSPAEPAAATAQRLAATRDGCVLVVGHSNTIPAILDAVTGRRHDVPIADDEYGLLFIATRKSDGAWSLIRARY